MFNGLCMQFILNSDRHFQILSSFLEVMPDKNIISIYSPFLNSHNVFILGSQVLRHSRKITVIVSLEGIETEATVT